MKRHEIRELFRLGSSKSGHYGHAGRPGKRGGSVARSVAMSIRTGKAAVEREVNKVLLDRVDMMLYPEYGGDHDRFHQDRFANEALEGMVADADIRYKSKAAFNYEAVYQEHLASIQDALAKELAEQYGVSAQTMQEAVAGWTAGPANPNSAAVMRAVSEKFEAPLSPAQASKIQNLADAKEPMRKYSEVEDRELLIHPIDRATANTLVENMYNATQQYFKSNGITHVHLMRGMGRDALGVKDVAKGDFVRPKQGAVSSWTPSSRVAGNFADMYNSVVVAADIPVERILSFPPTGLGSLGEGEVLVVGTRFGPDIAEVVHA